MAKEPDLPTMVAFRQFRKAMYIQGVSGRYLLVVAFRLTYLTYCSTRPPHSLAMILDCFRDACNDFGRQIWSLSAEMQTYDLASTDR
jgi:hypothetical protein